MMKRHATTMATVVAVAGLLGAAVAAAQPGMGRGRGPGAGARMYDPKTVETVTGVVERIDQIKGKGRGGGLHALLKTDSGEIMVHLGPSWYLNEQPLKVAPDDRIEVRGSRVVYEGKPAIIAAEIKKGDQTLRLRDANGIPLWSRQGQRPRGATQ